MNAPSRLCDLSPAAGARKRKRRLGLGSGSGHGQTSTRGQKGQRSRSGDGKQVGFEGGQTPLLRRVPKRGFSNASFREKWQIVSLKDISRLFKNQAEVTLDALKTHGLIKGAGKVKVLGPGILDKPIKIFAHAFSKSAAESIRKAGGEPLSAGGTAQDR